MALPVCGAWHPKSLEVICTMPIDHEGAHSNSVQGLMWEDGPARVTAATRLEAAAATYRERNALYKDNYYRHGATMMAIYPDGITLSTVRDFNRFGIINMIVSKLTRYATEPNKPHVDSIHDLMVYAAMLEEVDSDAG